jgi:cell division protein FtsL
MSGSATPPPRSRPSWWSPIDKPAAKPRSTRRRQLTPMQRLMRNRRFRTLTRRGVISLMVLALIACSVGVIALNNLVIKRSAELGRLDDERRQLRTDNALLAADIARLSAPPRITQLARTELGMRPSDQMARFIYLDPANAPPRKQRRQRMRAATADGQVPAAPQGVPGETPPSQTGGTP